MAHEKKNVRVKSDDKTKTIKVESTTLVKKYVDYTWKRLAGITTSEAATRLSRGRGVPSKSDSNISDAIHELVRRIDQFRPMVLWSGRDATPYRNRNLAWKARLMKIAEYVSKDAKPVYILDEVNKILRKRSASQIDAIKSSIKDISEAQASRPAPSASTTSTAIRLSFSCVTSRRNSGRRKKGRKPSVTGPM